jgi:hypothetical protein
LAGDSGSFGKLMDDEALSDGGSDGQTRVEGRVGVLEHHLDSLSQVPKVGVSECGDLLAIEHDAP